MECLGQNSEAISHSHGQAVELPLMDKLGADTPEDQEHLEEDDAG